MNSLILDFPVHFLSPSDYWVPSCVKRKQGVRTALVSTCSFQSQGGNSTRRSKDRQRLSNRAQGNTRADQPTGQEQPQGSKSVLRKMTLGSWSKVYKARKQAIRKRRGHFSGEERAWWCSSGEWQQRGRVQRPLSDETETPVGKSKPVKRAQHLRILNTWIWKRRWAHFWRGTSWNSMKNFEYTLRVNTWVAFRRRITWSNVCFPGIAYKACQHFLSNIQCQSVKEVDLKSQRGKNKATILHRGGRNEKNTIDKLFQKQKPHRFISIVLIVSVIIK